MESSPDVQAAISKININIESSRAVAISVVKVYFQKLKHTDADTLADAFIQNLDQAIRLHEREDQTDLARFYRLIAEFKPTLLAVLKPGKDIDAICDIAVQQFNVVLDRVRRQLNETNTQKSQLNGKSFQKNQPVLLQYFCTVCQQTFEIPPEMQAKLLNSDEKIVLPKHHDKEMVVKIGQPAPEKPQAEMVTPRPKIDIYPAELLMQHSNSTENQAEYLKLLSVGIDVGSSTSHLVFSRLTLKREWGFFNMTHRFILVDREVLYTGNILFTPLLDRTNIDIDAVVDFFKEEYKRAKIGPEQVDTGAVIVTGETAKKKNASEIVRRLSSESGKFVSATAGPNYESVLAAMGCGMVDGSRTLQKTILNVDVGGGSTKLAVLAKGEIISTSSINVGGRLLGIDPDFKIWRIDDPARIVMDALGMSYQVGDNILEKDVKMIAGEFAKALVEVMRKPATSPLATQLMMTPDLDFSYGLDLFSFSGGVSELIYAYLKQKKDGLDPDLEQNRIPYNDIGWYLAKEIVQLIEGLHLPMAEPENKIRATVIGAGAFSLSVSGSTCYYDGKIPLPLDNVPVVSINTNFQAIMAGGEVNARKFKDAVALSLGNFNLLEGVDLYALFFPDIAIRANLPAFAHALEKALPNSFAKKAPLILILGFDGAKMLGLTLRKETGFDGPLFCLDELFLDTGDWIDIGPPLAEAEAFPITIKSLVFNLKSAQRDDHAERAPDEKALSETLTPDTIVDITIPNSSLDTSHGAPLKRAELDHTTIPQLFSAFQAEHPGYEALLILSSNGDLEFSSDPRLWTASDIAGMLKAWQGHEPAFVLGDNRYPILTWDDFQFAACNKESKAIIVGTKTKSNRYVILKCDPGTQWAPNIASYVVKVLKLWAWDKL
jgi:ethanolamine utilization protein EutA